MSTATTPDRPGTRPSTLVWIDAREAVIVRWQGAGARIERMASDVPAHHRATGHVRHDPSVRMGGGGPPQWASESHRLEHLDHFVEDVANLVAPDDDVLILGPGTVRERLERHLREGDEHHGRRRDLTCEASPPLTDRQLVARLRAVAGADPRRRTVGAYRWSKPPLQPKSGQVPAQPRRVVEKPRLSERREPRP
jgi:hypothetical protein